MNVRHRVGRLEKARAHLNARTLLVVWRGEEDGPWRKRVAWAMRHSWGLRVLVVATALVARDAEHAEEVMDAFEAAHGTRTPLTVYPTGDLEGAPLATRRHELPEGLADVGDAS